MHADIPTLFLAAVANTLALVLTLVAVSHLRGMQELRQWGYALVLHAGTYVLLALRGRVPDWLSIVGANTCEAMFMALWIGVIATMQQRTLARAVVLGPVLLTAAIYAYFIDDMRTRVLLGNPVLLFQLLTAIHLLRRRDGDPTSVGRSMLRASLMTTVVLILVRLGAVLMEVEQLTTLTSRSGFQTLIYLTGSVIPLVASVGFLVMTKERTDRLVEEGKRTLTAIFDSVEESIILTRADGTVLQVNRVGAGRVNSTPQQLVGHNLFDGVEPEVAGPRKALLQAVARNGRAGHMSDQRGARSYRLNMYPVDGEKDRFVITGTDVTDEVAALASLRRSEAHFRAFFERAMFGMATLGADKHWLSVNDALCQMLGYPCEELLRTPWDALIYPDDRPAAIAAFDRVMAGATNEYTLDKRFVRKDGRVVYTHIAMRCMRRDDGSVDYFVVVFEDITQRKADEQERASRLDDLTEANRKLKAAQSQLLQSEKMAAVGQLAAGMAHEVNNPVGFVHSNLHSLRTYAKRLLALADAAEQASGSLAPGHPVRKAIALARQEADIDFLRQDIDALLDESLDGLQRVRKIVADLKDFSHVDQAEWQEADINHALESTLNVAWNELKYKAEVVRDYGAIPPVRCIPAQLNQVFLNLLINAGQAIEDKGTVTLRTRAEPPWVVVEVQDSGSGMPADIQPRIFEPFFTTKPVGKGTGLGLSISWDIIQRHQGTISVESEPGHGALFRIRLPIDGPGA
jgi:PAS domain S-box-containing protein